jgi:RNA polymerase sigma-70 factor (ECF subfamily)
VSAENLDRDNLLAAARWLAAARAGAPEALGPLLQQFRQYLLVVAREELGDQLQAKVGPSDLVQDTFVEAQRVFARFTSDSPEELRHWLRAILRNKVADCQRHFLETEKRQVSRELTLGSDSSQPQPAGGLADPSPSPSGAAAHQEQLDGLLQALERLPAHYQQVLRWRYWEKLSYAEIGQRLGRSEDAARMLWARAVEHLQKEMGPPP